MLPGLEHCLRAPTTVPPCETISAWWPRWRAATEAHSVPAELALRAGFDADRVAWAFAGGYQAALHMLVPSLPRDALAAFCATEENGNRPRDIQTTLTGNGDGTVRLDGAKRWTTLGPDSNRLLIVVRQADSDPARPRLKVVMVPADAPGLSLQLMPETGFVPEVPHARIHLDAVRLPESAVLAGDGYDDYVKPFRTCEDIQVSIAALAYLLREARARAWPTAYAERIAATLLMLLALADEAPAAATTHLALTGALHIVHALYAEADTHWANAGDAAAQRWQRDRALFAVAGTARSLRAQKAWEQLAAN